MAGPITRMVHQALREKGRRLQRERPEVKAALTLRSFIVRRTRNRGLDRHGRPFVPYAPSTRRAKRRRGQRTDHVTLTASGQMLDRLRVRQLPQQGPIRRAALEPGTPRDDRVLGFQVRGAGRLSVRDPWGATPRERRQLARRFNTRMERIMRFRDRTIRERLTLR